VVLLVAATGLTAQQLVALDVDQLDPADPGPLRRSREPQLVGVVVNGVVTAGMPLDRASAGAIADYLARERPEDADANAVALFLPARTSPKGRSRSRLSSEVVATLLRTVEDPAPASDSVEGRYLRWFSGGSLAPTVADPALLPGRDPATRRPGRDPLATAPRHNLPAYASTFVGRSREIDEISTALAGSRLVTLTGVGGIGKTRLAQQVAARALDDHADGVWLVELAGVRDPDLVAEAVTATVPSWVPGRPGSGALTDMLTDRRLLVVLDNCEHLVAGCAALADHLLRCCPGLSVLVTSREPLGVAGEHVCWMAPLELPGSNHLDTASLAATDAVRLFVERAKAADPTFAFNAVVAPTVAEICRRLDGLPLAIELAAARMAILSPDEIRERLDDRFRLLASRRPAGSPRHQTLRAALEWSHDLLAEPEAILLRRLAVFAGSWSMRAAEDICSGGTIDHDDILDLLEALVAKSLVLVDRHAPVTRYRMLESVRHFALEKLEQSDDADVFGERHARWCTARAERAERERRGRRQAAWLMALEEDHDNFRAALTWARDHQRVDMVLALGGALSWFWQTGGHLREGLEWLKWAVERQPDGDSDIRARALRGAGMLSWLAGDVGLALPMVEESRVLFRNTGNEAEADDCVCSNAFHLCANPAASLPDLAETVERLRAGDDRNRLAHALVNCGLARFFTADIVGAAGCFDQCLSLPLGCLDAEVVGHALLGLGRIGVFSGDFAAAEGHFREALDLAIRTGDLDSRITALSLLGELSRSRGELRRARLLLGDALELLGDDGPPFSVARAKQFLARVEADEGNVSRAGALYRDSLSGSEALAYHLVRSVLGLAETAAAGAETAQALDYLNQARAIAGQTGDRQAMARTLAGFAAVARACGDLERQRQLTTQSLEIQERIGDLPGVMASIETLAGLAVSSGRLEAAARLLGAAETARDRAACPRPLVRETDHTQIVDATREGLGPAEYERAWAEGAGLSLSEAASYAVRGKGRKGRPSKGWAALSPAEQQVVGLVTEGLTNAEIGERLFISPRTVSTHLHHVYSKLDIASRRALTRMAKEQATGSP
jgi:predicted ATPase/DNA-binding CsgD family transcriptional regulator